MTDLPVSLFPFWAQLLASTGSVLCLLLIVWRLPLAWLKQAQNQHLLLGATVAVLLIWAFRAGISPGLSIHFLGVTSLTLIFGWRLALLSLAVVCVGMVLAGKETWASLGIVYLVSAVAPVALRQQPAGVSNQFFIEWDNLEAVHVTSGARSYFL